MNAATKRVSVITGAIAVVLVLIWYVALFRPEGSRLTAAHKAYSAAQNQIAQLNSEVSSLQAIEKQASADKARLATLDAAVPKTPDLEAVLDQLHALATSTGVQLTTVDPGSTGAGSSATSQSGLQSLTLGMNASGSYSQLTAFFKGMDNLARTVVVDNVSIGAGQGGLTAELSTQIFYQA